MKTDFPILAVSLVLGAGLVFVHHASGNPIPGGDATKPVTTPDESNIPDDAQVATFAAGCFWCVEEVFHQTPGVLAAVSGYMGGRPEKANYQAVCRGDSGHAEAVQVYFDAEKISYADLVALFWKLHDPTQLNRQGPDRGTQYRSEIFYYNEEQRKIAEASKAALDKAGKFGDAPIVTRISPAVEFFPAEKYHQNYARLNPENRYLIYNLWPKLKKLNMKIPTGDDAASSPSSKK